MSLQIRIEKRRSRLLAGALWRAIAGAVMAMLIVAPASAETIRVAKTIGVIWALMPVDIAQQTGIFAREGLQVEISTLAGDPKVIEGFVGGNFDMALASGTSMMFAVKGAPIRGVAALNGAPRNFSLIVLRTPPSTTPPISKARSSAPRRSRRSLNTSPAESPSPRAGASTTSTPSSPAIRKARWRR
jgi:hypothetical protein